MSQFPTTQYHHGWYDTRFSMPIMLQQPCPYYPPPCPVLPYSTWMNSPPFYDKPLPTNTPQIPTSNVSPLPNSKSVATLPAKGALRSILKKFRTSQSKKKFVRFAPSTASPRLAEPGTHKLLSRPKPPRAQHPARGHPCLGNALQQHAQQAMTAVRRDPAPPPHPPKQASKSSRPESQCPIKHFSRPPTPPPADFFQKATKLQSTAQRPHNQPNMKARRQSAQQQSRRALPPQIPGYNIHSRRRHNSVSDQSNTDAGLADLSKRMKQMAIRASKDADVKKAEADAAATRRSLRALAKEFDRKNAWRRVLR